MRNANCAIISCNEKALEMAEGKATIFSTLLWLLSSASISLLKLFLENTRMRAGYSFSVEWIDYSTLKSHTGYFTAKMHPGSSASNPHLSSTTSLSYSSAD